MEDPFDWVDAVNDYEDETVFGSERKRMSRGQMFLMELFWQSHPDFL